MQDLCLRLLSSPQQTHVIADIPWPQTQLFASNFISPCCWLAVEQRRQRLAGAQALLENAGTQHARKSKDEREHCREQVCPAGWKPGENTMKPDPKGKLDYFAAL